MARLEGKTVIVTGASSGIGLAIAKMLGAEGANVVLSGRQRENMDAAAKEIEGAGGKALVKAGDVTDEKVVAGLVDAAVETFGALDVMINNAGYNPFDPVINGGDYAKWKETLEVNVLALALGCREAVRVMQGKSGQIVNVTSVAARSVEPDGPMYAASKHAAGALTESLRVALQGQNIRMTAIMPGAVATNLVRSMPQEQLFTVSRTLGIDPDEAGVEPGEHLPQEMLDRVATMAKAFVLSPEDIAQAVLFAVTMPESVHVNEIMVRPSQPLQMPGLRLPD